MEKLRLLEDKKKLRQETLLKRKQLQIKSIHEQFECQKKELEIVYVSFQFFENVDLSRCLGL